MKSGCYLIDLGITSALGEGREETRERLLAGNREGLAEWTTSQGTFTVAAARQKERSPLAPRYDNRCHRLLAAACDQIRPTVDACRSRFGAGRVAAVIGSTDNGAEQSLAALKARTETGAWPPGYEFFQQSAHASSAFVKYYLGLGGPACNISTACTSSARALVLARNLLEVGACDAVVAGGGDIVSETVLLGFHALEAVDRRPSNPFSRNRRGINLGEGAALFVLTREPGPGARLCLLGCGESSDAYHATAPEPEGRGAEEAMRRALAEAGLESADIDYINLHGTGTDLNDRMESKATHRVFPDGPPASSTKTMVGHTLGAAGAIELGFCWLLLARPDGDLRLPPHLWDNQPGEGLPLLSLVPPGGRAARLERCMSNSYAFGGCNVSLILGRERQV